MVKMTVAMAAMKTLLPLASMFLIAIATNSDVTKPNVSTPSLSAMANAIVLTALMRRQKNAKLNFAPRTPNSYAKYVCVRLFILF